MSACDRSLTMIYYEDFFSLTQTAITLIFSTVVEEVLYMKSLHYHCDHIIILGLSAQNLYSGSGLITPHH